MKIKIVGCSEPNQWYKDSIGQIFDAVISNEGYWKTAFPVAVQGWGVLMGDYKIVEGV